MYKEKKIIVVSPVGRTRSLKSLFKSIDKHRHVVDEYHLWVNTNVKEDLDFINSYASNNLNFVKLKYGCTELDKTQFTKADNVKHFYNYCVEKDTFYFKIDDDIVYIEPGMFEKLAQYKLDHPETFLVYPTILNNHWCTHFLRKKNKIDVPVCNQCDVNWYNEYNRVKNTIINSEKVMSLNYHEGKPKDFMNESVFLSPLYWNDASFAEKLLKMSLNYIKTNTLSLLSFESIQLTSHEPVSINCIMFSGDDFEKFNGNVRCFCDEPWLTTFYPLQSNKTNVIVGDTRCVHYAYYPQRDHLNSTNLLEEYFDI